MPWKIVEEDGQFCVYKENDSGEPVEKLKCYDDRADALAYQRALYANEADAAEPLEFVTGVELAAWNDDAPRPVEFLRVGVFTDANGRTVEIDADLLDALVANFQAGLAGQDVPIDILHRREEAAGWVQEVYRAGDMLYAVPQWNALGRRLVGDKVYRYLSATIDLARKVLRSISLVNFPAVKGLRPVELIHPVFAPASPSQVTPPAGRDTAPEAQLFRLQETPAMADEQVQDAAAVSAPLSDTDLAEIRAKMEQEVRRAVMAEYAQFNAEKERMLAELMAQMREERETIEFAQAVTTAERALPFTPDEVKALLFGLPVQYRPAIKEALRRIVDVGLVDLSERGTGRGKQAPQPLPAETAQALRSFLNNGGKLDIFFAANPELGPMANYDLKEYGNG